MADRHMVVTYEKENVSLYLTDEENKLAVVSIGHMDYRALFYFDNDEDAVALYDIFGKLKEFIIN